MIVTCTNCNSKYSVDDKKVENKKFGFTCMKCDENVVINNRGKEPVDTSLDAEMPLEGLLDEKGFQQEQTEDELDSGDIGTDAIEEEMPEGLSLEEDIDLSDIDLGDIAIDDTLEADEMPAALSEEETDAIDTPASDEDIDLDALTDLPEQATLGEEIDISEEEIPVAEEEDIDLSDIDLGDIAIDDTLEADEMPAALSEEETDAIDTPASDEDIDLDAFTDLPEQATLGEEIDISEEEIPVAEEEDIDLSDIDLGDIAIDDTLEADEMPAALSEEETDAIDTPASDEELDLDVFTDLPEQATLGEEIDVSEEEIPVAEEEDIDLSEIDLGDIHTLEAEQDTTELSEEGTDEIEDIDFFEKSEEPEVSLDKEIMQDKEANIDEEFLPLEEDIAYSPQDIEDAIPVETEEKLEIVGEELSEDEKLTLLEEEIFDDTGKIEIEEEDKGEEALLDDENIAIDIDSLDLELEEDQQIIDTQAVDQDIDFGQGAQTDQETGISIQDETEEHDVTIDIDALDIDLDEVESVASIPNSNDIDHDAGTVSDNVKDETSALHHAEDDEMDITIDVESLDIQLEEDSESPGLMQIEENSDEVGISDADEYNHDHINEDVDITIDLDSLDLPLEEVEVIAKGETLDEDDRLIIEDTSVPIDELVIETKSPAIPVPPSTKSVRLQIDESIDTMDDDIDFQTKREFDDLPEIDLDDIVHEPQVAEEDNFLDLETRRDFAEHQAKLNVYDDYSIDMTPAGTVNFSIDYSLKCSPLSALARLLGLYYIKLIPHLIVSLIYTLVSTIVGAINWLLVLLGAGFQEDFLEIQENTLRYLLSIDACAKGVVEDSPIFFGRKDIDHPIQFEIVYPVSFSKFLAFLRLTVIGILIAALPHMILLIILSLGGMFIYLMGIISVLVIKRWPKIFFDFMVRYYRYTASVLSYIFGLVDKYPSFKFE
ncbi:MAG: hypothetical protein SVR08_08510 [Spirochaetota bacterium]|nr:hypothetical protein [Spirochaetota bacterium]